MTLLSFALRYLLLKVVSAQLLPLVSTVPCYNIQAILLLGVSFALKTIKDEKEYHNSIISV